MARLSPEAANKIRNTPGVAMCNGKIVARWDRSGSSHWVVGSTRIFDGVPYRLVRINVTPNLVFHMCEQV